MAPLTYVLKKNMLTRPPSFYPFHIPAKVLEIDDIVALISLQTGYDVYLLREIFEGFQIACQKALSNGSWVTLKNFFWLHTVMPGNIATVNDSIEKQFKVRGYRGIVLEEEIKAMVTFKRITGTGTGTGSGGTPVIIDTIDSEMALHDLMQANKGFVINGELLELSPGDDGIWITSPAGNQIQQSKIVLNTNKQLIISPAVDPVLGPAGKNSVELGGLRVNNTSYHKRIRMINEIDSTGNNIFLVDAQVGGVVEVSSQTAPFGHLVQFISRLVSNEVVFFVIDDGITYPAGKTSTSGLHTLSWNSYTATINIVDIDILKANILKYSNYFREVVKLSISSGIIFPFWIHQSIDYTNTWRAIAYNGIDLYVAVASEGPGAAYRIAYSTDGLSWKYVSTSGFAYFWRSVEFFFGKFFALASDGHLMSSPDGKVWTQILYPESMGLNAVANGMGVAIAVISDLAATQQILRSTNGITWTLHTSPIALWGSVAFGNSTFVAASEDGKIMRSTNLGLTWSLVDESPGISWVSICYLGGRFTVISDTGVCLISGNNGATWSAGTDLPVQDWTDLQLVESRLYAVSSVASSSASAYSDDNGDTWEFPATPDFMTPLAVSGIGENAVMIGNSGVYVHNITPETLLSGEPVDSSILNDLFVFYAIEVPSGSVSLTISLTNLTDDLDLYARKAGFPSNGVYDYASEDGGPADEIITIPSPSEGIWYISIASYGDSTYTLTATLS